MERNGLNYAEGRIAMRIEWGQSLTHLLWIENRLGVRFNQRDCTWLASISDSGELLGVVVYERCTKTNCEMSVAAASPKFLSKNALRIFFSYPFLQLKLRRVTAVVSSLNSKAYVFNRRLGFEVEGQLRNWFEDSDGIILGLQKEDCKWL